MQVLHVSPEQPWLGEEPVTRVLRLKAQCCDAYTTLDFQVDFRSFKDRYGSHIHYCKRHKVFFLFEFFELLLASCFIIVHLEKRWSYHRHQRRLT